MTPEQEAEIRRAVALKSSPTGTLLLRALDETRAELEAARAERDRLSALLNTPEVRNFGAAVVLEALHQRERWGTDSDAGKTAADWFWLIGYLAGKALHAAIAGNVDKALHHTISTAAACANWHAHITGASVAMRPGTDQPAEVARD